MELIEDKDKFHTRYTLDWDPADDLDQAVIPLVPNFHELPEGTIFENEREHGYRMSGVYMKVGGKIEDLFGEVDDYGTPHPNWCTITELGNRSYWSKWYEKGGWSEAYWHRTGPEIPIKPFKLGKYIKYITSNPEEGTFVVNFNGSAEPLHIRSSVYREDLTTQEWNLFIQTHVGLDSDIKLFKKIHANFVSPNGDIVIFFEEIDGILNYDCLMDDVKTKLSQTISERKEALQSVALLPEPMIDTIFNFLYG